MFRRGKVTERTNRFCKKIILFKFDTFVDAQAKSQ